MSQLELFEDLDESMSFVVASRAKTSAPQGDRLASTATAPGYGASSPEFLARYDRDSQSWRTSQCCWLATAGDGFSEYLETWPRSGLMRNGTAYQLPPLVRLTGETAYGLLPTPTATDYGSNQSSSSGAAVRPSLQTMARRNMLPTPLARDWKSGGRSKSSLAKGFSMQLPEIVKQFEGSGVLNPEWVEWLMGFPIGWTDLED